MTDYTIIKDSGGNIQSITRNTDKASIPVCAGNMDYSRYLIDVDNGATVDEYVIPEPTPQPSLSDMITELKETQDAMKPILDELLLGGV